MKAIQIFFLLLLFSLFSCQSIHVNSDHENGTDFSKYKTFAYSKNGIDKLEISDIDKRRILRAIDAQMLMQGFQKNENPDFLVNIFTKSQEDVQVNQNNMNMGWGMGWGWGWGMGGFGNQTMVSTSVQGTLYIDFIDAKSKLQFWQGEGNADLPTNYKAKEIQINKIVTKILMQYPPVLK